MVNNIRDIESDRLARKRTLAVLVGRRWAKVLFGVFLFLPFPLLVLYALVYPIAWLGMLVLLLAIPAGLIAFTGRTGRELILSLQLTSFTALGYAAVLGIALAF
jgi:1,4-dihydroxy-2-naphthoate octaprenyltransferase